MERRSLDGSSQPKPTKPPRNVRSRSKSLASLPPDIPSHPSQPGQDHTSISTHPTVLRKIPRPPNAFILYRSNKMRELKQLGTQPESGTGLDKLDYQRKLSGIIGELWRNETAEVKAAFYEKSKQAAREHAQRYPEYRFKPRKSAGQAVESSKAIQTPDRNADNDFSPAHRSGPLSGSGSGSGRKRASLDGARSRASPYSTTQHRRASSSGPSSPSPRQTTCHQTEQPAPVLLHATPQPSTVPQNRLPVTRSVSYGTSSQPRNVKSPARRSLDGQASHTASASNSFNTLLPHHLRDDTRVYLAPPPIPIGLAITTDEAATATEEAQHEPKPKITLSEAVKRALPPERRALLHASLVKKGLIPSVEAISPPMCGQAVSKSSSTPTHSASNESTPSLVQSDSFNYMTSSTMELGSQHVWQSQEANNGTAAQISWPGSYGLAPALDPANQASLPSFGQGISNVNIDKYSNLADWNLPDACWQNYSQSQSSSSPHSWFPPLSAYQFGLKESTSNATMQHSATSQQKSLHQSPIPPASFADIDLAQYQPLDYSLNLANSAVVALSSPNEVGQVQGHFYNLDGELIGQSTVSGHDNADDEEEQARQNRAVQQLLLQLMESSYPIHPIFDNGTQQQHQQQQEQQQMCSQGQDQWQSWPTSFLPLQGAGVEQAGAQLECCAYSTMSNDRNGVSQANYSQSMSNTTSQEWTWKQQELRSFRMASPTMSQPGTNFSRPMLYSAGSEERGEIWTGNAPEPSTQPSISTLKREDPSTIDAAGLGMSSDPNERTPPEQENDQPRANKGLRSWKANHFASIKEKFSRVRHRSSPSTSSLSLIHGRDTDTHAVQDDG